MQSRKKDVYICSQKYWKWVEYKRSVGYDILDQYWVFTLQGVNLMEILWLCNRNTNATSLSMIANYHDFKSVFLLFTIIFGFGGDITLLQVMRHAIQTKLLRKLCFKCFIFPFILPFSSKHYSLCYSKRYNCEWRKAIKVSF